MLTRSPVPASSSHASPRIAFPPAFHHYASASSPPHSPSRLSVGLLRRPSTSSFVDSTISPSSARPNRYIGVDAATQYSPRVPVDFRTGAPLAPLSQNDAHAPLGSTMAGSMAHTTGSASVNATRAFSTLQKTPLDANNVQPSRSMKLTPPSKRRSSHVIDEPGRLATDVPKSPPKRHKTELPPPKVLSARYELCAVEDMVVLISHMLEELIETNDSLALKSGHLTRFHSRTAPGISVSDYLNRLARHATLTPPLLLSMVYYIDRLCAMYPEFTINTLTVHRYLITAATVAAKGLSDTFWNNSTYARVGGVRVAELKMLELEFLYRVDWKIVPQPEVLVAYFRGLVDRCPGYVLEETKVPVDGGVGPGNSEEEEEEDEEVSDAVEDDEDDTDDPNHQDARSNSSDGPHTGLRTPGTPGVHNDSNG